MIKVEFLGPIGKESIEVEAHSISELSEILKLDPELKPWLDNSAVAINDTMVNDTKMTLKDGDKVSILPPVCGG